MELYRICKTNISHERSEYIAERMINMNDKTIKELAIYIPDGICDIPNGALHRSDINS